MLGANLILVKENIYKIYIYYFVKIERKKCKRAKKCQRNEKIHSKITFHYSWLFSAFVYKNVKVIGKKY